MDRNMSSMGRLSRRSPSPPRGGPIGSGKLRMDRKPNHVRINDPSHPAGKRKEIDNVMRKARAFPNETWDKKLLEVEEKDPNRWRHTGFKKMYIEDDPSSSDSERGGRFGNGPPPRRTRSRSPRSPPPRHRRSPSPPMRKRRPLPVSPSPPPMRRRPSSISPPPPEPMLKRRPRSPPPRMMRRPSPQEFHRKSPFSAGGSPRRGPPRRMSPGPPPRARAKRPPSPPPKISRSPSITSCSDESCSACSIDDRHHRLRPRTSRSISGSRPRLRVASPPSAHISKNRRDGPGMRPMSPSPMDPRRKEPMPKVHRVDKDPRERPSRPIPPPPPPERIRHPQTPESDKLPSPKPSRVSKHKAIPEDPRPAKVRPPKQAAAVAAASVPSKKHKDKNTEKLRARVKIEGEPKQRRPRSPSSGSEESSSSESSLPRFTATTRLTLSERFGKMAQWSVDRSNMENMRITKNSAGGDLKVMIEEEMEAPPPVRYTYSPAPAGHFPEELMTTGPSGLSSWDDVRVRYEYYKGRGYLRDLDLQDYIKWEEWWYKYQEWLKQERYYELWERSQMNRRRKKVPITQRLN
ncbi:serine/arginine repetitive matrix protein 1 [Toxorhynchites rutilus septentrionalis]|uniref:serine/arginine repetitive matrix protein 1 n=1 Tax=Toxorhynchites rutilus septentrionalis TaxID=329112 RepID=UPI0024793D1F|nr:serine/arginine repetitive matrix protein 1 [Toxorhynchites rutilus septentrionalis]XP_055641343.1 serine/arginine repetitive matrix protein 1 [Toxorhynchites rutilus septentrionalis]